MTDTHNDLISAAWDVGKIVDSTIEAHRKLSYIELSNFLTLNKFNGDLTPMITKCSSQILGKLGDALAPYEFDEPTTQAFISAAKEKVGKGISDLLERKLSLNEVSLLVAKDEKKTFSELTLIQSRALVGVWLNQRRLYKQKKVASPPSADAKAVSDARIIVNRAYYLKNTLSI